MNGVTLRNLGASLRVSSPGFGWLDTNLFQFSESSLDPVIEGRSLKGKKVVNQGLAVASCTERPDPFFLSWKRL